METTEMFEGLGGAFRLSVSGRGMATIQAVYPNGAVTLIAILASTTAGVRFAAVMARYGAVEKAWEMANGGREAQAGLAA